MAPLLQASKFKVTKWIYKWLLDRWRHFCKQISAFCKPCVRLVQPLCKPCLSDLGTPVLRPPSMGTPSLSIPGLGIPGLGTPGLGTPVWRPLGWRPPVLEPCSGDHQRVWGLWFGKSYASIVQAWRPLSGILVTVYKWLKSNTLSPDDDSSYYQLLERGLVNLGRVKKTFHSKCENPLDKFYLSSNRISYLLATILW